MSGHTVVHRPPGFALKAHVVNAHVASLRDRRSWMASESIATLLFEGRRRVWVSEDVARQGKRRSLIDDNPTSG